MTHADRGAEHPTVEQLCRASVRVGAMETWYTSWGRGAPVVVFLEEPLGWAPSPWLSSVAGTRSRLILPEVPRDVGSRGFSRWFGDFLDGLGIESAAVAAESSFDPRLRSAFVDLRARLQGPPRWIFPPYRS